MKNTPILRSLPIFSLLSCLFLVSCHKQSKSATETTVGNYKAPETIPLQFTDPEPFIWETVPDDSLIPPVTYDLNVDALPSKPFELNTFKPLKSPMKEYDLDWDNLPSEKITFDTVPFTVKKSAIKKPTITKMNPPSPLEGTTTNLLRLATDEGLPSEDITAFLETEDGGIWIGSSSGNLTLYDGENALVYEYPRVYDMTFDKQGRLWLAMVQDGLYVLDFKNDIEYRIDRTSGPFIGIEILCDHTGTIYMNSYFDALFSIDQEMKNLTQLTKKGNSSEFTLFEDNQNNLWIGFNNGLGIMNEERDHLKMIPHNENYNLNTFITDIKEDTSGNLWICLPAVENKSEILRISLKEQKIKVLNTENGYDIKGQLLEEDNQGNLWIVGDDEVLVLSKDHKSSKSIDINSTMIGNARRTRIVKRTDGTIWIGTVDKGVVIANEFTLNVEYIDSSHGLLANEVWDIIEDSKGDLWLATNGGINIIDTMNNTIKSLGYELLHCPDNNTLLFTQEISKDVYLIDAVFGFSILDRKKNKLTQYAIDKESTFRVWGLTVLNGHTFIFNTGFGLFLYDLENNNLKKLISQQDHGFLENLNQTCMVYDGKEILWVPTAANGLAKIDLSKNTISYLGEEQGLCDNRGTVAKISSEGELWVATQNGIGILNLEQNTLTNLKRENGLIPAETYDLVEKRDIMYAASVNGLIPIEKASVKTTNKGFYNFDSGLGFKYNDYLEGSPTFLRNGQFWTGVADPSSRFKLMVLNSEPKVDRTKSTVQISNMFVMDENPGFGLHFKPDSTKSKASTYASINSIRWDSVKQPYNIPEGLTLPYNQNSLSFSYGSVDVFNRDKLNYRFILDGEDEDWSYAATATKTKNYYNLKPGDYTFKVAARHGDSGWSPPDMLSFKINPPWWQTWWAYLLFGVIVASILRAYIVFRARKLTKENRILEERVSHRTVQLKKKIEELKSTQSKLIQSEKMASLGELTAGIAHEIQNPLNFVNNFSEVNKELLEELEEELQNGNYEEVQALAKDVSENEDKIIFHGKRADGIVKGMLQHSRSSSGQKELTDINTLSDEYLRLAYHGLRAKDKSFNATLNTDFDGSIGKINIVPQDMGRVILNLITNAFYVVKKKKEQHPNGYEPTVSVHTKKQGNMALISVLDNGNGVPKEVLDKIFQPFFTTKPSGEGTGLGLSLSYDIVKVHGGELKVETLEGEGTTFTIAIPLN